MRVSGVAALAVFVLCAGPASAQDAKPKGEKVFADNKCSYCHSVAGKGNPANPLDGMGAKLKAADIKHWLLDPQAAAAKAGMKPVPMKSFAHLPPADIDALVAYVQSLK